MAAHRFRLARVLRVRHAQERIAQAEWATAQRGADQAQGDADRAAGAIQAARKELAQRQSEGQQPAETLAHQEAIDSLGRHREQLSERAERAAQRAATVRVAYDERRRERLGLERLEERERLSHEHEALLEETAQMDEIASVRAARTSTDPRSKKRHDPRSS